MLKKSRIITLFTLSAIAIAGHASTINYSYASDVTRPYGVSMGPSYYAASMALNDPALAGSKITGVSAYITTADGIEDATIWISKELQINSTDKVIIADIAEYDVTPVASIYGNSAAGLLEYKFSDPYQLPEDISTNSPIYVGYSFNVNESTVNLTEQQRRPLLIAPSQNNNSFWFYCSRTTARWVNRYDMEKAGVVIIVEIEGDFPEASLSILSSEELYSKSDEVINVPLNVTNFGGGEVNSVSYSYTDSGKTQTGYVSLEQPLMANPAVAQSLILPINPLSEPGLHNMELTIDEVNGAKNESTNPTINLKINIYPDKLPVHRPLVEEYTGLWCGWCPRGYIGMERVGEEFGDEAVVICYHNDDPMAVTNVYPYPFIQAGFPNAAIDRQGLVDPYYGSYDEDFGIAININNAIEQLAIADIQINNATFTNGTVNVETEVNFIVEKESSNYMIGYVIVENGLQNKNWAQVNYYGNPTILESQGINVKGTGLEILTEWDQNMYGLTFNDVAINVDYMNGIANSVPSKINLGESIFDSRSIKLSGNQVLQDPNNLIAVAFIIDGSTKNVINSCKMRIDNPTSVENIEINKDLVKTEYFDLNGRKISNPEKGIYIKNEIYSDGSMKKSKFIK